MARSGRTRLRVGVYAAVAAAVVIVVVGIVLFRDSPRACGCSIGPDDEAALTTARDYVAALAAGDDDTVRSMLDDDAALPDAQRTAALSDLAGPATAWFVAGLRRPEGGDGNSPAERVVVGSTADGAWAAILVHTDTDYSPGRVGPELTVDDDVLVARGGAAPIFGDLDLHTSDVTALTLVAAGGEPEPIEMLDSGGAWVYTGPGLEPGRHLVTQTTAVTSDDPVRWRVSGTWFEVGG